MLDASIYENRLYSSDRAAYILQAEALTPYLSHINFAHLLQQSQIPRSHFKRWDYDALQLVRKNFLCADLYTDQWQLNPDLRHELSVEASKNTALVAEICKFLSNLKQDPLVKKQWYYLRFYLDSFPKDAQPPIVDPLLVREVVHEKLCSAKFDLDWLKSRSDAIRPFLIMPVFDWLLLTGQEWAGTETVLEFLADDKHLSQEDLFELGLLRLLQGKPWRCHSTNKLNRDAVSDLDLIDQFLHGKYEECYTQLREYSDLWCKAHHVSKFPFIPGILGVIFYTCRFRLGIEMDSFFHDCEAVLKSIGNNREALAYDAFQNLYINKYRPEAIERNRLYFQPVAMMFPASIFGRFIIYLGAMAVNKVDWVLPCQQVRDAYACLPVAFNILNDMLREFGASDRSNMDVEYLPWVDMAQGVPRWQRQMDSLKRLFGPAKEDEDKKRRLVWLVDFSDYMIKPYVQTMSATGKWSPGKSCPWQKLGDPKIPWISDQDREIRKIVTSSSFFGNIDWFFSMGKAIVALAGHPYIFDELTRQPLTLEHRKVPLSIKEENGMCRISLGKQPVHRGIYLEMEGPGKWVVYSFSQSATSLNEILGEGGMLMPTPELPAFLNVMQGVKDLDIDLKAKAPRIPGNPEPVIQLWQQGTLFLAKVRVRPSGEDKEGALYAPGEGKKDVLQVLEGKTVMIERDLAQESELAQQLIKSCASLSAVDEEWNWSSDDLEDFFELLSELKEVTSPLRIEWPEGEKFKLLGRVRQNQISVHTRQHGDWFALSGEVKVNEIKVLELSDLLERSNGKNRFVQLKNGEFIQLSDDIRRTLERLRLFTSRRAGNERQVHPLAGSLVQEICDDMEHDSDIRWNDMISRMRTAFELKPEVPTGLQAELRPYQKTGFVWLCRLSEWGVGGCLADDMGLGKTVQAIAVMLREAQKGPCLIIAPTSVCPNWVEELNRFAPSLQVVRLRDADDRKQMVESMQKGMVMVTGYGLLPRERDILSMKPWQMVVFDEAQALKNSTTQRSRAAHKINAHFHLALTGTPIENHLEDLWSVFDIINPGLLGSLNDFHRRFGDAAEGGSSAAALKMLIRPFILRRLKSQVLDDLPDLTEQTIIIEPTEKEAAFYESLRRNALKHVSDGPQAAGQKRFNILSELTRLRRACCHASLADPQAAKYVEPVSSKLARFLELLEEARSGGHRLLVFSQFTGHLALVRAELDKAKIPYQYLDGATPEEQRRVRVAAFQRGEGDVFLISLKAGGQGLNLTAADYVVHMDPWWNPAVEDQATDRAHRIGQKKTVTVYRLVMAHSVEEKILTLHARKRDLAADFLEGSEEAVTSATLSEEELLALLQ